MLVVKKKRELGLINIANSKVIRYKQKQTTAMQKNRCNGKFAVVLCRVCSNKDLTPDRLESVLAPRLALAIHGSPSPSK